MSFQARFDHGSAQIPERHHIPESARRQPLNVSFKYRMISRPPVLGAEQSLELLEAQISTCLQQMRKQEGAQRSTSDLKKNIDN